MHNTAMAQGTRVVRRWIVHQLTNRDHVLCDKLQLIFPMSVMA